MSTALNVDAIATPRDDVLSILRRLVKVQVELCECTGDCGEGKVTQRWREVEVSPESVTIDVTDVDWPDENYFWLSHDCACLAALAESGDAHGREWVRYEIEAQYAG